jgi:hypothetical protein
VIEVVDDTLTGEVLLDEALKMMKSSEKMSVSAWIDLMSGKRIMPFLVGTGSVHWGINGTMKKNIADKNVSIQQVRHGTS